MNLLIPGVAITPAPQEQAFSTLEQALRSPQREQARAEALAALDALEQRVRLTCSQGLPPGDFAQANQVLAACAAARETLIMPQNPGLQGSSSAA